MYTGLLIGVTLWFVGQKEKAQCHKRLCQPHTLDSHSSIGTHIGRDPTYTGTVTPFKLIIFY